MGDKIEAVDPLTPETFSFEDVLSGDEYPKDEVEVFLNERAAHAKRKLHQRIMDAPEGGFSDEEKAEILAERDEIEAQLEASKYTFKLTGVADDLISDVKTLADEKFHVHRKAADGTLRQVLPEEKQMEYMRFFSSSVNALHVEAIISPSGAVMVAPSVEEIARFYDKAPTSQKQKLSEAIAALKVSAEEFESRIDSDF